MKNLILMFLLMSVIGLAYNAGAATATSNNPPTIIRTWKWGEYVHTLFALGGHWYLEVRYEGPRHGGGVTIIHYANCPEVHGH